MKQTNKSIKFSFSLLTSILLCSFCYGQNQLTEEMIKKINLTDKQGIYSVAEVVKFDQQVLRADELVFSPNSVLELTNLDYDYILIVANKIKFTAPLKKATIKRAFDVFAENGTDGNLGSNGVSGTTGGKNGSDGTNGGIGQKGGKGKTKQLPKIYIITNEVTSQASNQALDYINLKLLFPGIDGGSGGNGGRGGNGGNGGNGRKSSSGAFDCKRGGGDGGNGGLAGKGGQGGDGGDGGNGADIFFIASDSAMEILSYSVVINTGGDSVAAGLPGAIGFPGFGGGAGAGSIHCSGGDSGANGKNPVPLNEGNGQSGKEGAKGKIEKFNISNVEGLHF